ncbi:alkyl sulfatase dimerization domain-containing protein [Alloalcanivorax xenomutans]|uniref:alkyl sulfatase dimerization domain-containing protein n=1 Tax=Alloalcanivorax xenomutans TaxID=1094342 RepID=UPI0017D9AC42|nr:alkyl sulfatase dimerization domain-containing protein [Alloalcanivorax xenomutans]MBA4720644.1 MBL fold metallo-hydrolase [Alcanivorax sp.]WOD26899.1 alkyl sulfatase dimerization domain-containing protein [Alloalcanivorax xenomutans]
MTGNSNKKESPILGEFLLANKDLKTIAPGVHLLGGQGNSVVVETANGVVITDSGPGGKITRAMIEHVRQLTDKPVLAIVYSHGHLGYNHGAHSWLADAAERGHPRPKMVAQANLPRRYDRYQETWGLQAHLNGLQFNSQFPETAPEKWFTYPDITFRERHVIDGGDRQVEILEAPSETDDAMALWLPEEKILYAGPAFIKSIPNIGTPLRTLRDPVRWAETMERLLALEPEMLIPEFGRPIEGREAVREAMTLTIKALRYLREETVKRMNRGMTEAEILHDIAYPDEIFGHPLMKPSYGMPEYIVRDIWRSENGWWDRNATQLHPGEPDAVAAALREAISDPEQVLTVARRKREEGQPQLALHVLDLLSPERSQDEIGARARALKAEILEQLAEASPSFVSAQIYRSVATRLNER